MSATKRACICSICVALCYVLPLAFHAFALGAAFCPIHLPVLLCGLLCGWPYGAFCGIAGPLISCTISGMPSPVQLIYMIPELLTYGLVAGLLMGRVRTGKPIADIYLSMVPAMVAGRIVGGAAQAAFYLSTAREYSVAIWAAGYLLGTLPGTILHLTAVPALVVAVTKAKLVPPRYPPS